MMGNTLLRGILKDIKDNSGLFSLLADESRDISNKEQLTCILRWVSLPDLEINEDFIRMYLIKKTGRRNDSSISQRYTVKM